MASSVMSETETDPESKRAQVMVEALAKAAELILLNRIFHAAELPRKSGCTHFNIEVDKVDVVRGIIEYWRRDICLPLRLLIVWRPSGGGEATLLERWDLHHAWSDCEVCSVDETSLLVNVRRLWKKLVIVLRTLYSVSVALPAARLARKAEMEYRRGTGSGSMGFAICTQADSGEWLLLNGHASAAYEPNAPLNFDYSAAAKEVNYVQLPPARCVFGTWKVTVSYLKAFCVAVSVSEASQQVPALKHVTRQETGIIREPMLTSKSPSGLSLLIANSSEPSTPWLNNDAGPSLHPDKQSSRQFLTNAYSLAESSSPLNGLMFVTPTRLNNRKTTWFADARPVSLIQNTPLNASFGYGTSDSHRSGSRSLLKGDGSKRPRASELPHYAPASAPGSTPPFASPVSNSPQNNLGNISAFSPPFAALHAQSSGAVPLTRSNGPSGSNRLDMLTCDFLDTGQSEIPSLSLLIPDRASSPWFPTGAIGDGKVNLVSLAPLADISRRPKIEVPVDLPPFAFDAPPDAPYFFHSGSTSHFAPFTNTLDGYAEKTEVLAQWCALRHTLSAFAAGNHLVVETDDPAARTILFGEGGILLGLRRISNSDGF